MIQESPARSVGHGVDIDSLRLAEMLEDDPTETISLDSERRVKGICQLMEGLIYDVRVTSYSDPDGGLDGLQSQFSSAIESLDDFLEKGYYFIAKYRNRGTMGAEEEQRYRRIIEEKHEEVYETLKREYMALGMTEAD